MIFLILTFFAFFNISANNGDYPEPYRWIKLLPLNLDGWFSEYSREPIKNIMNQINPKTIVEVGSWMGLSTSFIAQNMPNNCILYAIDTWNGSPEHKDDPVYSKYLPNLYALFLSNMRQLGLAEKIVPIRMSSIEAVKSLNLFPDFIYLDASHKYEDVCDDISNWYKKLKPGGILSGDDWMWPSVRTAVEKMAKDLNQNIHVVSTFWWFDPKK